VLQWRVCVCQGEQRQTSAWVCCACAVLASRPAPSPPPSMPSLLLFISRSLRVCCHGACIYAHLHLREENGDGEARRHGPQAEKARWLGGRSLKIDRRKMERWQWRGGKHRRDEQRGRGKTMGCKRDDGETAKEQSSSRGASKRECVRGGKEARGGPRLLI
jgi:hypothetical protein